MARERVAAVHGGLRERRSREASVDGRTYSLEMEEELNRLAWQVFGNETGRRFMAYLRNITVNTTFDHDIEPIKLMHFEGRRWLVGMIAKRIDLGEALR